MIIPYAEMAWTYFKVHNASGGMVSQTEMVIYTKDGKKFSALVNRDDFARLMTKWVLPNNPNVIVGYGKEQKQRYKAIRAGR